MIILVRHAQSEGNKNRDVHQFIPDHRIKLTPDGWNQAEEAGRRLRSMLKPDDTLQFFTSPYRRTRETTEGILRSLTSDDPTPSPFPRHKVKVFEEPRLREQDFGNFQPCSAEMERMWQERADYGHFFYRIPSGESAADAYDRISGFNESMWRLFGEEDFPSVCVLVTHGLMTRVFLMKWYHWSVEYFEDLRNVNHCEFIVMKQSPSNGKYILQNELRTWSEFKRRASALASQNGSTTSMSTTAKGPPPPPQPYSSPTIPIRRWGGCANGCNHDKISFPRRTRRQNTADLNLPPPAANNEKDDNPVTSQEANQIPIIAEPSQSASKPTPRKPTVVPQPPMPEMPFTPASPNDASNDASSGEDEGDRSSEAEEASMSIPRAHQHPVPHAASIMRYLHPGRDFGGSMSGTGTPAEGLSDDSDYFPAMHTLTMTPGKSASGVVNGGGKLKPRATSRLRGREREKSRERKAATRKMSEAEWVAESGMGLGARADALGDGGGTSDDARAERNGETPILKEALKGCMEIEEGCEDEEMDIKVMEKITGEAEIERMKEAEKKGFDEVY